jgi:hypothetical protein
VRNKHDANFGLPFFKRKKTWQQIQEEKTMKLVDLKKKRDMPDIQNMV